MKDNGVASSARICSRVHQIGSLYDHLSIDTDPEQYHMIDTKLLPYGGIVTADR